MPFPSILFNTSCTSTDSSRSFPTNPLQLLSEIHKRYYFALGAKKDPRRPTRPPDVKEIIDRIKSKVLQNVNLVFSGVIPLGVRPES